MTLPELQAVACPNPAQPNVGGTIRHGAVLALGTSTGWALQSPDGQMTTGTASLKHTRYDGGGMRFLRFRRWLEKLDLDAGLIAAIYFEEVRRHIGTDAAHVHGGLLGVLTAWCEEHLVACQGVPVGTIRRFIAGKGNASELAQAVRGFAPADDNEADAIAILLWAIETRGGVR